MMTDQVDGEAAHVQTCALCGELFDSVESLDAHLSLPTVNGRRRRCRDPFMVTIDGDETYMFDYEPKVSPVVWSLNTPAKVAG
jgi:hypothetical protein